MFRAEKSRVEGRESREKMRSRGHSRRSTLDSQASTLNPQPSTRRGITLIELLVVISIMLLLAAVAIPRMRPMMQNRNLRESARALNVFVSQARVRAMETGRPCGVLFQRAGDRNQPDACTVMRQVEIPPPYAGNVTEAAVIVQDWTKDPRPPTPPNPAYPYHWAEPLGTSVPPAAPYRVLKVGVRVGEWSNGLVRQGDVVQLGYQGPLFEIAADPNDAPDKDFPLDSNGFIIFSDPSNGIGVDSNSDGWVDDHVLTLRLPVALVPASPWPPVPAPGMNGYPEVIVGGTVLTQWSPATPMQIYRQPTYDPASGLSGALGSATPSLQLPRGVVVDLGASGVGAGTQFAASGAGDASPVIVMFSPNGAMAGVCYQDQQRAVASPVFLLVGRWERMLVDPAIPYDSRSLEELTNWQDPDSFWLAINQQTGLVTAAEPYANPNGEDLNGNGSLDTGEDFDGDSQLDLGVDASGLLRPLRVIDSRRYAREAQVSKGGR